MLKNAGIIFLVVLAIIFQQSFLANFFAQGEAPNFILVALIVLSAIYGFEKIWKLAALAGFLADIFSFLPVGLNIFAFMSAVFAASILEKRFLVVGSFWRIPALLVIVAAGTLVNDAAIFLAAQLFAAAHSRVLGGISFSLEGVAVELWHNSAVFILLYWPLTKMKKYLIEGNNFSEVKLKYQ